MAPAQIPRRKLTPQSRDVFSKSKRSQVMALIRAKDTKPEMAVRQTLHALGFRFRLHDRSLPGRPDILLCRHGTIIQVKGCFWHSHRCLKGRMPYGNRPYWIAKLSANQARDRRNERLLRKLGWRVRTIWECAIRRWPRAELAARLSSLLSPGHGGPRSTR